VAIVRKILLSISLGGFLSAIIGILIVVGVAESEVRKSHLRCIRQIGPYPK